MSESISQAPPEQASGSMGISLQAVMAGILTAVVGFSSSFAVVLKGLIGAGATQAQAASGLMALSISMGLCAVWLSLRSRQPISVAWSTPGAALLAATGVVGTGFASAVGAFLITALLIIAAGLVRPLGRAVSAIPPALANAMLAGILFSLCLAPVKAVAQTPWQALAIIAVWALVGLWRKLLAIPAAVLVTALIIAFSTSTVGITWQQAIPNPVLIIPDWSLAAMIGIAFPLFLVTMASQNIPGMAVLNANDYRPDPAPLFRTTGLFSLASAPFGGHAVNLSAITAALCANPDAHADPTKRYWASVTAGLLYVVFGLLAGAATAFASAAPPILIEAVAGLALLGTLAASLNASLGDAQTREPAIVTFVVAASGLSIFGIGAAFWGLLSGGGLYALQRLRG
jgi:benzoate membrane transport protein